MPIITPSRPNTFSGGTLDRAAHLRPDEPWIAQAHADPASRFVVYWQGKMLIADTGAAEPRAHYTAKPAADALILRRIDPSTNAAQQNTTAPKSQTFITVARYTAR